MSGPIRIALLAFIVAATSARAADTSDRIQLAACFYGSPGCAEWYVDSNHRWHSIRSNWRGILGRHRVYRRSRES